MKIMFIPLTMSSIMVMSSNNWVSMWIGMEINMVGFVPMMKSKTKESSKSMTIYFLAQSMGSSLFLYALLSQWLYPLYNQSMMTSLVMMSMMIKMGVPPMHAWMVSMMKTMDWTQCFILMTWQKLAPLAVMFQISESINNTCLMGIMCSITGSIGGLNQTSLRKIMAYSSISHMGWMLIMTLSENKWLVYITLYSAATFMLCYLFNKESIFFINQLSMKSKLNKISFATMIMNLGGLPPTMGFMMKWISIQFMIEMSMTVTATLMIMTWFYMNMTYPMLTMSMKSMKISSKLEMDYSVMTVASISIPLVLTINKLI
uniref:NADH-ubiquinone oxidoreductase chain 2 n=1 Tax=Arbanatus sp. TaxID=2931282 RepID=A0A8T9ZY59_9HEMI|nr:NADH dehydrogenase subunit 2 [Arbanatus sp.]